MALTYVKATGIDVTGNYTVNGMNVSANLSAANIKTDNLLYANGVAWNFGTYSNTNVAAYLPTYTGNVSANYFIGNGSTLTHITGGNVDGQVSNALVASTVYTAAQPNITSVGTLTSLTVSGITTATGGVKTANILDTSSTVTIQTKYNNQAGDIGVTGNLTVGTGGTGNVNATYFVGNGAYLTGLPASYSNTNVASYLPTYTGNVSANYFIGNGSSLSHITGGNVDGQVGNALVASTVYTAAQPNITSVGTLTSLAVSGGLTVGGNLTVNGTLTSINSTIVEIDDLAIVLANDATSSTQANGAGIIINGANANILYINSTNSFTFSHKISADGGLLSNITGANVTGTVANATHATSADTSTTAATVTTNAQPNITSVGTLSSLTVSGNVIAGNISTSGSGGNISGANNISANTFTGVLTTTSQPNITSVGTLTSLDVTTNITVGNLLTDNILYANGTPWSFGTGGSGYSNADVANYLPTYTGNITANHFIGNGSTLTSISGGNVTGQVSNSLVAGTVYTNAQPNITSVGTLSSVTVSGLVTAVTGGVKTSNIVDNAGVNTISVSSTTVGIVGNLTVGTGGTGNLTATYVKATSGITGNGVINLSNTSNVSLGSVSNLHITGGTAGYVLQTDGSGNLTWANLSTSTTTYVPNSLSLTNGVYVSGNISSIQTFGDYADTNGAYVLTDGTGSAPAWIFTVDFINVTTFNRVVMNINYTASSGHTVYVQLYNNSTTEWDNIGTYTGLGNYYAFALEVISDTNYINGSNIVQLRLYHSNGGNSIHTTSIDYIALQKSTQGPQGPRGPTGNTGPSGNVTISDDTSTNANYFPIFATANSGNFAVASVSSTKFQFNPSSGQLTVQDLNTLSDATLKTNSEQITDPFSVLNQLFGMSFNWADSGKKSYGLMAQMLEQILPELVSTNAQGKKTVNYIPIIAFLIEAVKKQQSDIEDLKKR